MLNCVSSFFWSVFHQQIHEHNDHEHQHWWNYKYVAPVQLRRAQIIEKQWDGHSRYQHLGQCPRANRSEVDHESEDAGKAPPLFPLEPCCIDFYEARRPKCLQVAIQSANDDQNCEQAAKMRP